MANRQGKIMSASDIEGVTALDNNTQFEPIHPPGVPIPRSDLQAGLLTRCKQSSEKCTMQFACPAVNVPKLTKQTLMVLSSRLNHTTDKRDLCLSVCTWAPGMLPIPCILFCGGYPT